MLAFLSYASGLASEDEGFFNFSLDSVIDVLGYDYGVIDSLWNHGGNASMVSDSTIVMGLGDFWKRLN